MKTCKTCGETKPFLAFSKLKSGYYRGSCKECRRTQGRAYYDARKAAYREQVRQWGMRHPNRIKGERKAPRRPRFPPPGRERLTRWKRENPHLYAEQQALANRREKQRGRPTTAKKRALSLGAFIEHIDRRIVWEAFEGRCGICDEHIPLAAMTIDHIVPLSRGGQHAYSNVQPTHGTCNRRKGNYLPGELDNAA